MPRVIRAIPLTAAQRARYGMSTRRRRTRRRTTRGIPYKGTGLTNLVRRIANRGVETKFVGSDVVNATFNSRISSTGEAYPLIPAVTIGTGDNQRIGDQIKPKYLKVTGQIMFDRDATESRWMEPLTVRCLILRQKNVKCNNQIATTFAYSYLLKDNVNTTSGRQYVGDPWDNQAPINKDLFTVIMDKKFKFKWEFIRAMGNSAKDGAVAAGNQTVKTFTKYIKLPKLYFDDANGNNPNNAAPFFCAGYTYDDGTGPDTLDTMIRIRVLSVLYYTDA